jgi:hypothetical protein
MYGVKLTIMEYKSRYTIDAHWVRFEMSLSARDDRYFFGVGQSIGINIIIKKSRGLYFFLDATLVEFYGEWHQRKFYLPINPYREYCSFVSLL